MATVSGGYSEWVGTPAITKQWSFPSTPSTGDLICLWVYQSTENNGPIGAASAAGYTVAHQYSSPTTYRGAHTLLTKVSDGTEVDATITWGTPNNYGCVVNSCFITGADETSLVASSGTWNGSVTYPAASLDLTIECLGINAPNTGDGAFTAGATQISEAFQVGSFRGAGWAVNDGGTTASPSATNGSWMSFSVSDAAAPFIPIAVPHTYTTAGPAPVVTILTPTENQQFQLPAQTVAYSVGADNVAPNGLEARFPALDTDWVDLEGFRDGNGDVVSQWSANFTEGLFLFEVRGTSIDGQQVTDSVTIEWLAAPAPVCVSDSSVTDMDTTINIDVLDNDSNVDASTTLSIVGAAANGTAVVIP